MRTLTIGLGYWGSKLAERLVGLVGYDNARGADLRVLDWLYQDRDLKPYGRLVGADYRELLNETDACIVATPPASHYEIAKACLLAGKHVLVEKPLTLKSSEAVELMTLAGERHLTLMVDSTWEYHDACVDRLHKVERLHKAFLRGNNLLFSWRNQRQDVTPEGLLWTQGPHPVALMLRVLGGFPHSPLPSVSGTLTDRRADLTYSFYHGGKAQVVLEWTKEKMQPERRIVALGSGLVGRDRVVFNAAKHQPSKEPLDRMLRKFLQSTFWLDLSAVRVVALLERTEQAVKREVRNARPAG